MSWTLGTTLWGPLGAARGVGGIAKDTSVLAGLTFNGRVATLEVLIFIDLDFQLLLL